MSHEWNATLYHQISAPQVSWGKKVLSRVKLRGDEHVLDAGCGTGRLTRDLLEALPNGQVTGLDLSSNMLRVAEEHLKPEFGERVHFKQADLQNLDVQKLDVQNLDAQNPDRQAQRLASAFDLIFSTASFHWVKDHDRLFAGLYRVLRPGGVIHAQCGGAGNLNRFFPLVDEAMAHEPYRGHFANFSFPWEFATAERTAERLRRAGFVDIETSLEEAPTPFPDAASFEEFVASVVLRRHVDHLADVALRQRFMADVTAAAGRQAPPWLLDYVRLNLRARKPKA
jgi:trans-aconitate methyltransferase